MGLLRWYAAPWDLPPKHVASLPLLAGALRRPKALASFLGTSFDEEI